MGNILETLTHIPAEKIIIYPNADAGGKEIIQSIASFEGKPGFSIYKSLPHLDFVSFMANSSFMVGNSSSGIIEAPTLKLPAINVGTRQTGRETASNAINVDGLDKEALEGAIKTAYLDEEFRKKLEELVSPYGLGHTSGEILKVLGNTELNGDFLYKKPPK